jgi:uncharacterized damage-inducible protein DinB
MSVLPFYDQWPQYNGRLTEVVAAMTPEQLALAPHESRWPIWATVAHTAGARVYWLCVVMGEPGQDRTPFEDPAAMGWEDDLDHPRDAAELVSALDSTWSIVADCLERWTPEMLGETITREYAGTATRHTRGAVLQRLFSHDAYHCGELSQTLGILELPQIDLWRSE